MIISLNRIAARSGLFIPGIVAGRDGLDRPGSGGARFCIRGVTAHPELGRGVALPTLSAVAAITGVRPGSSGWAISSAGSRQPMIAATARNTGTLPASTKVIGMPIHSPTGPAIAIDTGIRASETKKSRLETRPSRCGGTRRCSSVPQMTIAAGR